MEGFFDLENTLAILADHIYLFKQLYVIYYRLIDENYHKKGRAMALIYSAHRPESSKKNIKYLCLDMIYYLHRFGASFSDYFLFGFDRLNTKRRSEFITDKLRYAYCEILNDRECLSLFDDKLESFRKFGEYYGRLVVACKSAIELIHELSKVQPNVGTLDGILP